MTKWDKWLDSQNETTQIYFKNRMKEDNPLIYMSIGIGVMIGFIFGLVISL